MTAGQGGGSDPNGELYAALAMDLCGAPREEILYWLKETGGKLTAFAQALETEHVISLEKSQMLRRVYDGALRASRDNPERALQSLGISGETIATLSPHSILRQNVRLYGPKPSWERPDQTIAMPSGVVPGRQAGPEVLLSEAEGRYEEKGEVARGGFGQILAVRDNALGREVALKQLLPENTPGGSDLGSESCAAVVARFLHEAMITAQMEHPSIVPVYEVGQRKDGSLYYTMKLVRGRTMARAIEEARGLPGRLKLLPNFVALCQAIGYAHSKGVIHRDIKPSNVIIGEYGETIVLDWGLAKSRGAQDVNVEHLSTAEPAISGSGGGRASHTVAGEMIGTPSYMPPEQARGDLAAIDERSDVFGLGAVLYALLAGHAPFKGDTIQTVIAEARGGHVHRLEKSAPDAPPELVAVCRRAMASAPQARYQSAMELADEIQRFLSGTLLRTYSYTPGALAWRFLKRYRVTVATAAAGLAALAILGTVSVKRVIRERDTAQVERSNALSAQAQANKARDIAEQARDAATRNEALAEQQKIRADRELYAASIGLTQSYIERRQYWDAQRTLERCDPAHRGWEWGWLLAQVNQDLATRSGRNTLHGSGRMYDFSPANRMLAARKPDKHGLLSFRVEEVESGNLRWALRNSPDNTFDDGFTVWSPDGSWLVLSSTDRFRLFSLKENKYTDVLPHYKGHDIPGYFSPDSAAFAYYAEDLTPRVIFMADVRPGEAPPSTALPSNGAPGPIALSPGGDYCALMNMSGTGHSAMVYETRHERLAFALPDMDIPVVHFAADGKSLYFISRGNALERVVLANGSREKLATLPESRVVSSAICDAAGLLALGLEDGSIVLVTLREPGQAPRLLRNTHRGKVTALAFDDSGTNLLSGGGPEDRTVARWSLPEGHETFRFYGHSEAVDRVWFVPGGSLAVSGGEQEVKWWDATCSPDPLFVPLSGACSAALDETNTLLCADNAGQVHEAPANGLAKFTGPGPSTTSVNDCILSPEGTAVVTRSVTGITFRHIREAGEHRLATGDHKMTPMAISPDGKRVALLISGEDDYSVLLDIFHEGKESERFNVNFEPGDLREYAKVLCLPGESGGWCVLSQDRLAVYREGTGLTGEYALAEPLESRPESTASLTPVSTSHQPETTFLLAYSIAGNRVALARSGSPEGAKVLEGHSEPVTALAFSDDATRLVSASRNGEIRLWDTTPGLWDASAGRLLLSLPGRGNLITEARFSMDGHALVLLEPGAGAVVYRAFPREPQEYPGSSTIPFGARVDAYKLAAPQRASAWDTAQRALLAIATAKREAAARLGLHVGDSLDLGQLCASPEGSRLCQLLAANPGVELNQVGEPPVHPAAGPLRSLDYLISLDRVLSAAGNSEDSSEAQIAAAEVVAFAQGDVHPSTWIAEWMGDGLRFPGAVLALAPMLDKSGFSGEWTTRLLADAALETGRYTKAIEYYRYVDDVHVYAARALAEARAGMLDPAIRHLEYFVRFQPRNDNATAAYNELAARPEAVQDPRWAGLAALFTEDTPPAPGTAWHTEIETALAASRASGKPLLLYAVAHRDGGMEVASRELAQVPYVAQNLAARFEPCLIHMPALAPADRESLESRYGLGRPPVLLLLNSEGGWLERHAGPLRLSQMVPQYLREWEEPGWVRDWCILGPLPIARDAFAEPTDIEAAYMAGTGTTGRPLDVQVPYAGADKNWEWHTVSSPMPSGTFCTRLFNETQQDGTYFAYFEIEATSAMDVRLDCSHAELMQVYLNGVPCGDGSDIFQLVRSDASLRQGHNSVLVKFFTSDDDRSINLRLYNPADPTEVLPLKVLPILNRPPLTPAPAPAHWHENTGKMPRDTQAADTQEDVIELVWANIREEFRASTAYLFTLGLKPVLTPAGEIRGITSANFSSVPAARKLGLSDNDILLSVEDITADQVFSLVAGNLALRPEALPSLGERLHRRAMYSAKIIRDGVEKTIRIRMQY